MSEFNLHKNRSQPKIGFVSCIIISGEWLLSLDSHCFCNAFNFLSFAVIAVAFMFFFSSSLFRISLKCLSRKSSLYIYMPLWHSFHHQQDAPHKIVHKSKVFFLLFALLLLLQQKTIREKIHTYTHKQLYNKEIPLWSRRLRMRLTISFAV